MSHRYESAKAALLQQSGVEAVTAGSSNIIDLGSLSGDNDWDGKAANQTFILHPMSVDKDFLSFFKMKLVEGKRFYRHCG